MRSQVKRAAVAAAIGWEASANYIGSNEMTSYLDRESSPRRQCYRRYRRAPLTIRCFRMSGTGALCRSGPAREHRHHKSCRSAAHVMVGLWVSDT